MEAGDKLYCKKNLKIFGCCEFNNGKEYKITAIHTKYLIGINDLDPRFGSVIFTNRKSYKGKFYIWDYFYDIKELRKEKIKKLTNER